MWDNPSSLAASPSRSVIEQPAAKPTAAPGLAPIRHEPSPWRAQIERPPTGMVAAEWAHIGFSERMEYLRANGI
jgi:hypothetical protein